MPSTQPLVTHTISGSVWSDTNGNGVVDTSETHFPGVTVSLTCGANMTSMTTTTNTMGMYFFYNVTVTTNSCLVQINLAQNSLSQYILFPMVQTQNTIQTQMTSSMVATAVISLNGQTTTTTTNNANFGFVLSSNCQVPATSYSVYPCGTTAPFQVSITQAGTGEYCVQVTPNTGVLVSQVSFISFSGLSGTLSPTSTMDACNMTAPNSTWAEVTSDSDVCATSACPGFDFQSSEFTVAANANTLCLTCNPKEMVLAPLQSCFHLDNFSLNQFAGTTVQVAANGVLGFCDCSAQVTATLGGLKC